MPEGRCKCHPLAEQFDLVPRVSFHANGLLHSYLNRDWYLKNELKNKNAVFLEIVLPSLTKKTTCPVSVIGHLSTLPLHAHYAIHLPFAFHALAHPCFCPLLSTLLLLPTTLLLQASELNFCLSLLPPSILLIYSGSSSLKLILNISIFPFWFLLLDEKNIIIIKKTSQGKRRPALLSNSTRSIAS